MSVYAHNLGRFDAIEIIKGLSNSSVVKYDIKGVWKKEENRLLSLKIIDIKSRKYINLLDSLSLLGFNSLRNSLKSYNISIEKGNFPYRFVNKNNLNYIGTKPSFDLFDDITQKDYDNIPENN